jgi:hypothetical protein
MAEWGVRRTARTAVPAPSVAPSGVRAHMPPHSQGAERRTGRRAGRWGLRVLVVGGLAGTAWLLTGAAAHAADRDPASEGSLLGTSLIGSVVHQAAPSAVSRVLHAAERPSESDRHRHSSSSASVLDVPARVLGAATQPHRMTGAPSALGGVDRVVGDVTGPLRLIGGPARTPVAPVTAPLTDLLSHQAASPVKTVKAAPSVRPAKHLAEAPSQASPVPPATITPAATQVVPVDVPVITAVESPVRNTAHPGTVSRTTVRHQAARAAEPDTAGENQPGGQDPAPVQGYLGAVSGIPAGGSGGPTEGGSVAVLPATVAAGTMEVHRLPIATDVEVRRTDAEAPTVSPD